MANPVVHWEVNGKDGPALHKFFGDLFDWEVLTDNPMGYGLVNSRPRVPQQYRRRYWADV